MEQKTKLCAIMGMVLVSAVFSFLFWIPLFLYSYNFWFEQ